MGNRVCQDEKCVCQDGYGGIDCSKELCPLNCSSTMGQGVCDLVGITHVNNYVVRSCRDVIIHGQGAILCSNNILKLKRSSDTLFKQII